MIKEKIEEMGSETFLMLLAAIIILAFLYNFIINNLFLALVSMGIAVFGCYHIFRYISEEEEPELMENEELWLRSLDMGVVLFPRAKGKFLGREAHTEVSIYLTTERIFATKRGEVVFEIPIKAIKSFKPERKLGSNYLRVTYLEKNMEKDVLLFVGNVKLWCDKLDQLLKKSEQEGKEESINLEKLKDLIEK